MIWAVQLSHGFWKLQKLLSLFILMLYKFRQVINHIYGNFHDMFFCTGTDTTLVLNDH